MTAKEVFDKRIKIGTLSRDYGHTVDDVLHIDNATELDAIEKALHDYEELKRDVEKKDKLLELKNEQIKIFQFERNHFYSMTAESYEKLAVLQSEISKLESELK